ncbi:MAG: sigma-70 family RNA polymerase sigma factor, partial [Gemmatimonadaceae bacterium]
DARAWLISVATNLLRDERRTAVRRTQLAEQFNADTVPSALPQPDAVAEAHERRDAVRAALEMLPERDRRLLLLRHEGFSYHEIAASVGVAASSVGTLLIRATADFHAQCTARLGAHA